MVGPEEIQADCIESICPKLLENVGPHFRHRHSFISELARKQEKPLSVDHKTVRVPGDLSGQAIVCGEDENSQQKGIEEEVQAESHLNIVE